MSDWSLGERECSNSRLRVTNNESLDNEPLNHLCP